VQRRDDRHVHLASTNADQSPAQKFSINLDDLYGSASLLPIADVQRLFASDSHWAAYVVGAYYALAKKRKLTRRVTGANIAIASTVPQGMGLSSSAALEIAALNALAAAYHVILDPLETAIIGQRIENDIVNAPCGIMDQVTCSMGRADHLLLLSCQPHDLQGYLTLPPHTQVLGITSGQKHDVGGSPYRDTRTAAFMAHAIIARAYKDFGLRADPTAGYLANISPPFYRRYLRHLLPRTMTGAAFQKQFGETIDRITTPEPDRTYHVRSAADHHIVENARVHQFVTALRAAHVDPIPNLRRAGRLMSAAHASYSHRARLGSDETATIVRLLNQLPKDLRPYGAKITGGGSGGTVAVLAPTGDAFDTALHTICDQFHAATGKTATLIRGSSPGAAETPIERLPVRALLAN
jgi:galactokinase